MVDYRAIALTIWCVVYGVPLEESQNFVNFQTFQSVLDQKNYAVLQRNAVVNLTDLGGLQGSVDKTKWSKKAIYQFLGVKYAESPSGNRRFKVNIDPVQNGERHFSIISFPSIRTEMNRLRCPLGRGKVYEVQKNTERVVQRTNDWQI